MTRFRPALLMVWIIGSLLAYLWQFAPLGGAILAAVGVK